MNRIDVGLREFDRASGGRGPTATARVRAVSPALAEGVEEFIFADVFSRPALTARERELVTVAVLCALGGAEPQLGLHIPAALECGVDPDELVAMCEQLAPYAGFPRALNALRAVRAAIEERGLPLPLYEVVSREGPDHAPSFRVQVRIEGYEPEDAVGRSKQEAEKAAAQVMLLKREGPL